MYVFMYGCAALSMHIFVELLELGCAVLSQTTTTTDRQRAVVVLF